VTPYGIEHRNQFGATPLMLAALAGNGPLIDELLARGANIAAVDSTGMSAVMHAVKRALLSATYQEEGLVDAFERLAPPYLDVRVEGRVHRLSRGEDAYHVLLRMLSQLRGFTFPLDEEILENLLEKMAESEPAADMDLSESERKEDRRAVRRTLLYTTLGFKPGEGIEGFTETTLRFMHLPDGAPSELDQSQDVLAAVLSREDADHGGEASRKLWIRMSCGTYLPNPELYFRVPHAEAGEWQSLFHGLNLM